MPERIRMFSTMWCGHCRRLKRQLDEAGIAVEEVDVDEHREYEARIIERTGGFRTVPSVEVGDELLVNPSVREVQDALAGSAGNN